MKANTLTMILTAGLVFMSCNRNKDEEPQIQIPENYDGQSFNTNASVQLTLWSKLAQLTEAMKAGRTAGVVVAKQDLINLFNAGNPSLANEITIYFKGKLEGTGGWFDELAKASGSTWTPQAPDGTSEGGVYGGYLFDENGVEPEQLGEKGQFGATLYNHAVKLMSGTITLATVDQLLAIYGAKPQFANSGSNNVSADIRDVAMANYAARRDKNDGTGMYSQMKREFIKLQTYVKAGSTYNTERDQTLKNIQALWERINAATVINYCHSPITALSGTNPTDAQIGAALHAISEGIGFIQGFKTINPNFRKITDAQIDNILELFNAPSTGLATAYRFATSPSTELPKLQQIISTLQSIYGFTNQEIEDFRFNWVAVQGR
jgi:hypothetical protein